MRRSKSSSLTRAVITRALVVVTVGVALVTVSPTHATSAAPPPTPTPPRMVELPTLGGTNSEATAINDIGVSVGWSDLPGDQARHAVMWDRVGGVHDLGVLNPAFVGPQRGSFATAINNRGEIVGGSGVPFRWNADQGMTAIPLATTLLGGAATTINDDGVVGGELDGGSYYSAGFVWSPTAGAVPAQSSSIIALNDLGDWIGISTGSRGNAQQHGVMGSLSNPEAITVPAPGGARVRFPSAINNKGSIVGLASQLGSDSAGFVWSGASGSRWLADLGFDSAGATAIDDSGRIAGTQHGHAATWSPGTTPVDLGVLPGDSASAVRGLSNADQAAGFSSHSEARSTGTANVHRAVRWGVAPPLAPAPPPELPPPPPPTVVAPAPVPVVARPSFAG